MIKNPLPILLLLCVAFASFMDAVDSSIVNIILPVLAADFHIDAGSTAWVTLSYLLTVAGLILIFGKLADGPHLKGIFLSGFLIFALGSAGCAASPSFAFLLVSRVVQGVGASMIIACAPLICVKFLPKTILGLSFAVLTAAGSIGFAAGPAIGGVITELLSWHWVFLINVPIGIISCLFAAKILPKSKAAPQESFDIKGAVLIFIAVVSGIFCIERLPHIGLHPLIFCTGCLALLALGLFIFHERRTERPLIHLRVFTIPQVVCVYLAFFLVQFCIAGMLYLLPFYMNAGLAFTPMLTGLFMFITPVFAGLVGIPCGKLSDTHGRRWFVVGAGILFLIQAAVYLAVMPEWGVLPLAVCMALWGLSIGMSGGAGGSRIVDWMPDAERSLGSTLMITCQYFGSVLGTALFAGVFTLLTGVVPFEQLGLDVFLTGFHGTMLLLLAGALLIVILSAAVKDKN